MLFILSPIEKDYNTAVKSAEIVKSKNVYTSAFVMANYSYENYPNMGSKYGADVYYHTGSGVEAAWIATEKPIGIRQPIVIMFDEDINNFAVNPNYPDLPYEKPNEVQKKIALLLLSIPLVYIGVELALFFLARLFKEPFPKRPLTFKDPDKAGVIAVRLLRLNLAVAIISTFFLVQYFAATGRVERVVAQENIVAGFLSKNCTDRQGSGCDGRYKALYQLEGIDYNRLFQVKGDIIYDDDLEAMGIPKLEETKIPLLYNRKDPRFSYALSSKEQVNAAYSPFIIFTSGMLTAGSLVAYRAAKRQRRFNYREGIPASWNVYFADIE